MVIYYHNNKKYRYDFRQNDIKMEGAPLTPIFHQLVLKQNKIDVPSILNIGGISNVTIVKNYNLLILQVEI